MEYLPLDIRADTGMDRHAIRKLARDLTICLTLAVILIATLLVAIHYLSYSFICERQMTARMKDTYNLAKVMVIPLWNTDINMIRQISEAYQTCEYISGVRVETEWGKVLYNSLPEGADESLIREEHVRQSDHYFGRLKLQFTNEGTERTLKKTLVTVIIASLPVIAIIIIGTRNIILYLLNKAFKTYNRAY
ncbi:MAG: hypothetical protein P8X90_04195 [Desulfobacterales bacterium]